MGEGVPATIHVCCRILGADMGWGIAWHFSTLRIFCVEGPLQSWVRVANCVSMEVQWAGTWTCVGRGRVAPPLSRPRWAHQRFLSDSHFCLKKTSVNVTVLFSLLLFSLRSSLCRGWFCVDLPYVHRKRLSLNHPPIFSLRLQVQDGAFNGTSQSLLKALSDTYHGKLHT